jgi:DNA-binding transcriptional ArsR family regulator
MVQATSGQPAVAGKVTPEAVRAASALLGALAGPMRLAIVASLFEHGSRCVHQLVDELGAPQPLVSQHLRVLRGAQLVVGERRHREVHYTLVDRHVGHIVRDALEHVGHVTRPAELAGPADDQDGCPADEEMMAR